MDNVVQRLHAALAEALEERHPGFQSERVTVAEIYQHLVPYRAVRGRVGFAMNADYEHALLRLLAGEGGRVRLEPENVRDRLLRELNSPNPDVTVVRDYAACEVWVNRPEQAERSEEEEEEEEEEGVGEDARWAPPAPEAPAASEAPVASRPWEEPEPAARPRPWEEPEPEEPEAAATEEPEAAPALEVPAPHAWEVEVTPVAELEREMPAAAAGRGAAGAHCAFCRGALPPDRPVRFCPFCGVDQQLRPCPRCGEVLERGWRYCVTCGAPAPEPSASA